MIMDSLPGIGDQFKDSEYLRINELKISGNEFAL
jgi:hypothetical protein